MDLCKIGHSDNGAFPYSDVKVRALVKRALWRSSAPPAVIAIIDGTDRLEAGVCLDAQTHWYSDAWFWADRFLFVHPAHRRSWHAFRLLNFCRVWQKAQDVPVVISIETLNDRESKERLYSRYARRVGASYVIGTLPVEVDSTWPGLANSPKN